MGKHNGGITLLAETEVVADHKRTQPHLAPDAANENRLQDFAQLRKHDLLNATRIAKCSFETRQLPSNPHPIATSAEPPNPYPHSRMRSRVANQDSHPRPTFHHQARSGIRFEPQKMRKTPQDKRQKNSNITPHKDRLANLTTTTHNRRSSKMSATASAQTATEYGRCRYYTRITTHKSAESIGVSSPNPHRLITP